MMTSTETASAVLASHQVPKGDDSTRALQQQGKRIDKERPALAIALEAAEWPAVALDVRAGLSLRAIARGLRELGEGDSWAHYAVSALADGGRVSGLERPEPVHLEYEPWRHGGWYVLNVRHPSGAVGCVSRNYEDRKWRIVCDEREGDCTYPSREAAARAERGLIAAGLLGGGETNSPLFRKAALRRLAAQHDVLPNTRSTAGEDLLDSLERPEQIKRWCAVTQSSASGFHYLYPRYDTIEQAKDGATRYMEDATYDETPVEVVDLDTGERETADFSVRWSCPGSQVG
jgi:hypothetical protein